MLFGATNQPTVRLIILYIFDDINRFKSSDLQQLIPMGSIIVLEFNLR